MPLHGLTSAERKALIQGEPMASLPPGLRHEIFRQSGVRRYLHSDWIAAAGEPASHWLCCVKGSVRVSLGHGVGGDGVFTYLQPGSWFGEVALISSSGQSHDFTAHGDTTIVALPGSAFKQLLLAPEFSSAVLLLQASQAQALFDIVEDWRSLQLRPRVAKQLASLAGICSGDPRVPHRDDASYVGLTQGELARVVGASRQRVNHVLKAMERERLINTGHEGVHIRDLEGLNALWMRARTSREARPGRPILPIVATIAR